MNYVDDAGEVAEHVMRAWRSLPALYPPENWSGPVPPGYHVPPGAFQGMRSCKESSWKPVRCYLFFRIPSFCRSHLGVSRCRQEKMTGPVFVSRIRMNEFTF